MSAEAILKYPVVLLTGFATALVLTPLWRRWAPRWGFLDSPGRRKIHCAPIPRGGGVAIFIAFHLACAVLFLWPWKPFAGQISVAWWLRVLPLSAGVVLLGLLDDRFHLSAGAKLLGQIAIGIAACASGLRLNTVLGFPLAEWVDCLATVAWYVVLMNAFNLIDGVDGLATGLAAIAAGGIGLSLVFRSQPGDVLLFLGLVGACLGFLRYNFYPASVFLGDSGSHFLGFILAVLAIGTHSKASFLAGFGIPLLAVGIPLFDTLLAIWRRSMRTLLPSQGNGNSRAALTHSDDDHLHHRLLRLGLGQRQVAALLYAATLALVAIGISASLFHDRALGILVLAFLLASYTVVRHLAGIELRASGQVVLQGLSRPVRRNRTLLFYLAGDLLILVLTLWGVQTLWNWHEGLRTFAGKTAWLRAAPLDLFVPFACLVIFRSYSRVWYLARVSEYAATGLAIALGYATALGLRLAAGDPGEDIPRLLITYLLMAGIAAPAVVLSRAALRIVQDLFHWGARSARLAGITPRRALVFGAGYRTTLFLRQMSYHPPESIPVEIVGLVSDDPAITGHAVHGIRVLGTLADLPALVAKHHVQILYIVEPLRPEDLEPLRRQLKATGVQIIRWDIVETDISQND